MVVLLDAQKVVDGLEELYLAEEARVVGLRTNRDVTRGEENERSTLS